jgi:Bacterial mobilisation protein (MobC)
MEAVKKNLRSPGRPVKAIKKDIRACIRLTRAEYFIIKHKASQAGVKPSVYLRQTAIQTRVSPRLTAEELQDVKHLIGMSNNINQVAKICHREGLFEALRYFENYRNRLDTLLSKLKS